ncbi:MAG: hypothetical protein Q4B28_01620 [bacterium]|nr:hypothetical protein [bacterium]
MRKANNGEKHFYLPSLLVMCSFLYSLTGVVWFMSLLIGRDNALKNLTFLKDFSGASIQLFTSDIIIGAYNMYSYVGSYIAGFSLFFGVVYMLSKKDLQKILLICLILNFILAVYLNIRF